MQLHEALKIIANDFGRDIISESRRNICQNIMFWYRQRRNCSEIETVFS